MSEVKEAFDKLGKYLVQQSRSNLTREKHRFSSKLYNSLGYTFKENPNSIEFAFHMEDYGEYLDKGVKGKEKSLKAPRSPYRFGSGTGKKGGLTKGIRDWVRGKRFQFRRPNGRFLSYESTAWLITRSIYLTGLRTTEFYSKPLERAYVRFPDELAEAYGLEVEDLMKNTPVGR